MFVANTSWYLYNFRHGILERLIKDGYTVQILAPEDKYSKNLVEMGCEFYHIDTDGKTKNPLKDLGLLINYYKMLKKLKPDMIFNSTIKPNIYASMAASILKIDVINNVSGLGNIFINNNLTTKLVKILYRIAFRNSKKVFFQNDDDMKLFLDNKLVTEDFCGRLPGSGVNTEKFKPMEKKPSDKIKFILIARMLWDKGIGEYVETARVLNKKYNNLEFQLLGHLNFDNPTAISKEQMDKWVEEGIVSYLGLSDDVREQIKEADCVVLPSKYREGVPKTLIEAAAMEKPIITTDNVGCRDIVEDGHNGFLCKPKSVESLVRKIEYFLKLSEENRDVLGKNGRIKVEREFDEKIVIEKYFEEINRG